MICNAYISFVTATPQSHRRGHLLNAEGIKCGKHPVIRLRRLKGIQTTRSRRFRVMQAMERVQEAAPDLVQRGFQVSAPNKIWVGDIISLRTKEGWLHLAIVLDLFSRRIVGWSMSLTVDTPLPMATFSMALAQRKPSPGLIFHSDQGSVYKSKDYRDLLALHGV